MSHFYGMFTSCDYHHYFIIEVVVNNAKNTYTQISSDFYLSKVRHRLSLTAVESLTVHKNPPETDVWIIKMFYYPPSERQEGKLKWYMAAHTHTHFLWSSVVFDYLARHHLTLIFNWSVTFLYFCLILNLWHLNCIILQRDVILWGHFSANFRWFYVIVVRSIFYNLIEDIFCWFYEWFFAIIGSHDILGNI